MALSNLEVEAKFIIPDQATFEALRQLTHLGQFELKPRETKVVSDRYLDTADKRLFQAEWACRLRKVKDQQVITLKSLTPATNALHRRNEIETKVKANQVEPDQPDAWEEGQAQKLVIEIVGRVPLQTLFILHQTRYQFHVFWHGQPVIELSLDEVALRNPAIIDFRELEAELIEGGSEQNLTDLVGTLLARWPLQPQAKSKFERAWFNVAP